MLVHLVFVCVVFFLSNLSVLFKTNLTSISWSWSSITFCWCLMVPSSSLFRSNSVFPSSAASCKSVERKVEHIKIKWNRVSISIRSFKIHLHKLLFMGLKNMLWALIFLCHHFNSVMIYCSLFILEIPLFKECVL